MTRLPAGWVSTTLGELSAYVTSGSRDWSRYYADEGSLFVRTQDINQNALAHPTEIARVSLPEHVEGKRTLIQRDDILITITGANVGKCAHVIECPPEAYVSQSVALVRPVFGALAPFLQRQLIASPEAGGKTLLELSAYGLGRPVLSLDGVRDVAVRLAPLAEQRRIVAKLDAQTARMARARADLNRIPALAARYKRAVLTKAFRGEPLKYGRSGSANSGWRYGKASEVCGKVQSGGTPKAGFNATGGVPFLKVYNIVNQRVDFEYRSQYVSDDEHAGELRKSVARPGDVLMNIVGPPLGKVAIIPSDFPEWNINQALTLFRPTDEITSKWLFYFLCGGDSVQSVINETRGSAGQVNISLSQCREFVLPVPPLDEQAEIVARIETAFAEIDRLTAEAAAARRLLDRLDQAVLARAFRGELVPQDPADEPAGVLLDRIRAERAAAPKAKRGRKAAVPV